MARKKDQKHKQVAPHRLPPTTHKHWLKEGDTHHLAKRYTEALEAYDHAIGLDPDDALAYQGRGNALLELERYEEALAAYQQALQLETVDDDEPPLKGRVARNMKRYEDSRFYNHMGRAFHHLKRYEEALAAYEQAVLLDGNECRYHFNKG
ncbi:MAG TPA: tetratricopeptide repeat protein, partial [Ktedonobacteraceae bacterium]|nr:tetratricopeptide repeat protein [Ktedonobacteraceae bacterium]